MISRAASLRGQSLDKVFPRDDDNQPALTGLPPWPTAGGRKKQQTWDKGLVQNALQNPDKYRVAPADLDDANLRSTQPGITRAGVQHYQSDEYRTHGTLFADAHSAGNQTPMIYHRDDGISLLLSGHHRATAALLSDTPLNAIHVHGPWGALRA